MERYPTDFVDIQLLVDEQMERVHFEKKTDKAILTLEHHMSGKFTMMHDKRGYADRRVQWKRDIEFSCQAEYNPPKHHTTISNAQFGVHLIPVATEYYAQTKRGPYKIAPVIPKAHEFIMGNTKSLLMEPSMQRYGDYSRQEISLYGKRPMRNMTKENDQRKYLPYDLRMRDVNASDEEKKWEK